MCKAYPSGLTLDEVRKFHSKGNIKLADLVNNETHFAAAVALPGGPRRGGYRIRSVAEAEEILATSEAQPLGGRRVTNR
jgi:hypothetical protein